MFCKTFALVRLSALAFAVSVLTTSIVFAFPIRQSTCLPDEYYDGIDKKCAKCSEICELQELDFCLNNCPNYFADSPKSPSTVTFPPQSVRSSAALQPSTDPALRSTSTQDVTSIVSSSLDVVIIVVISVSAVFILAVVVIVVVVVVILSRLKSTLTATATATTSTKGDDIEQSKLIAFKKFDRVDSVASDESNNSGGSCNTDTTTTSNEYQKLQ